MGRLYSHPLPCSILWSGGQLPRVTPMTPIPLDCLLDQGLYGWRKYLLQRLPQDLAPQLGGFWAWDGCLNGGRWARGSSLASSQGLFLLGRG